MAWHDRINEREPLLIVKREGHGDRAQEVQLKVAAAIGEFFTTLRLIEAVYGKTGGA